MSIFDRFREARTEGCSCECRFSRPAGTAVGDYAELQLDATACDGDLATSTACRHTVISTLADRDVDVVRRRSDGLDYVYTGRALALLLAAGRASEQIGFHDTHLADLVARDPLRAASRAIGRAGPVSRIVAETGLASIAEQATGYESILRPAVMPSVASAVVDTSLPADATLVDRWETATGAAVRLLETDAPLRTYHLTPPESSLPSNALETLAEARTTLVEGTDAGRATSESPRDFDANRSPGRAVRTVASTADPVEKLTEILHKHTRGFGVLDDVFADSRVTDADFSAPITDNPLRVVIDDERLATNVRLPPDGAATLASRLRRTSGRAFSRASPTLDASIEAGEATVRVAATTSPASDGLGFTFRRRDDDAWTVPRLVRSGTLTTDAAGFLSLAVERGAAGLIAGGRGAGKTTMLGALLWELSPETRLVLVEDTPELPAESYRTEGRDVQRLRIGDGPALTAPDAVRTALRLGDGALVVGEVRGEEAGALYEAMRVGSHQGAVLGTIHGSDGDAVRERVVVDLGVPASAFGSTDLLVTLESRAVSRVVEVRSIDDEIHFEPLFDRDSGELRSTGVIERGNSHLLDELGGQDETYADVRSQLAERTRELETLVSEGRTNGGDIARAVGARNRQ